MMPTFAPRTPHPGTLDHRELDELDESPAVNSAVFIETEPEKEASVAASAIREAEKAAASDTVKVKVVAPYRVVHEGKPFVGGDAVMVPAELAENWIKAKWVERVTVSQKKGKA